MNEWFVILSIFSGHTADNFLLNSKSLKARLGLNVTMLESIRLVNNTLGSVRICSRSSDSAASAMSYYSSDDDEEQFLHPCSEFHRLKVLDLRDNSMRKLGDFTELPGLQEIHLSGEYPIETITISYKEQVFLLLNLFGIFIV